MVRASDRFSQEPGTLVRRTEHHKKENKNHKHHTSRTYEQEMGVLKVELVEARNLVAKDIRLIGTSTSDPCILSSDCC